MVKKNLDQTDLKILRILQDEGRISNLDLSKKIDMKFLPKLLFVKDESFDYAEKIENLIKQTNK